MTSFSITTKLFVVLQEASITAACMNTSDWPKLTHSLALHFCGTFHSFRLAAVDSHSNHLTRSTALFSPPNPPQHGYHWYVFFLRFSDTGPSDIASHFAVYSTRSTYDTFKSSAVINHLTWLARYAWASSRCCSWTPGTIKMGRSDQLLVFSLNTKDYTTIIGRPNISSNLSLIDWNLHYYTRRNSR
jgi:hypothetical protein